MSFFEISKFSLKRGGGLIKGGVLISDIRYVKRKIIDFGLQKFIFSK